MPRQAAGQMPSEYRHSKPRPRRRSSRPVRNASQQLRLPSSAISQTRCLCERASPQDELSITRSSTRHLLDCGADSITGGSRNCSIHGMRKFATIRRSLRRIGKRGERAGGTDQREPECAKDCLTTMPRNDVAEHHGLPLLNSLFAKPTCIPVRYTKTVYGTFAEYEG